MAGISSLLRSASAAQKKVQAQQDAILAYNWENSAQTYQDFKEYSDYLSKRASTTSDPSARLTLTSKVRAASRSYTSNEIQRKSLDIMNGRGSLQDKQNTIYELAQQAADNGDNNLLQNLSVQYSQIDKQIQDEAISQANAQQALASKMVSQNVKSVKQLIDRQKSDLKDIGKIYNQVGAEGMNKAFQDPEVKKAIMENNPELKQLFDKGGQIGFWDIANGITQNIRQSYEQAAGSLPPEEAKPFLDEIEKIDSGETKFKIPGVGSVTVQDLQNQLDATRAGGTYFYQGPDNTLEKGNLTNYTWAKDENGNLKLVKQFSQKGTENSGLGAFTQDQRTGDSANMSLVFRRDDKGNYLNDKGEVVGKVGKNGEMLDAKGKKLTDEAARNQILKSSTTDYKTLLTNNGFKVTTGNDGTIRVIPTEAVKGRFKELGINDGAPVEAVVDPQGNLRFVKKNADGKAELFQVGFDDKGKAYTQKLLEGGQGAVSAQDYFEMRQATKMFGGTTPFAGLNAGRSSLANTSELIARGENFRYGVLNDMEKRRKLLEDLKAPQMQLNAPERIVNSLATPMASAAKRISNIAFNKQQAAANAKAQSNLNNTIQKVVNTKAKYGALADPVKKAAFVNTLKQPEKKTNNGFAQKVAGFFGF
jgi:hypothetical protein